MGVSFNLIPSGLRTPLFFAEMDKSAAAGGAAALRSLIVGQMRLLGGAPTGASPARIDAGPFPIRATGPGDLSGDISIVIVNEGGAPVSRLFSFSGNPAAIDTTAAAPGATFDLYNGGAGRDLTFTVNGGTPIPVHFGGDTPADNTASLARAVAVIGAAMLGVVEADVSAAGDQLHFEGHTIGTVASLAIAGADAAEFYLDGPSTPTTTAGAARFEDVGHLGTSIEDLSGVGRGITAAEFAAAIIASFGSGNASAYVYGPAVAISSLGIGSTSSITLSGTLCAVLGLPAGSWLGPDANVGGAFPGQAEPGHLIRVASAAAAAVLFGAGSMLHRAAVAYFANDTMGELWAVPLADNAEGVKATASIEVTSAPTVAGMIPLYIGGVLVAVTVTATDTATDVAAKITSKVNDTRLGLQCGAAQDGPAVNLEAFNAGEFGNMIDVRTCYRGASDGEVLPSGLAITITPFDGGAGDPDLADSVAAMADEPFEFVAWPYLAATPRELIGAEMADSQAGRWGPFRQLYGHAFAARVEALTDLADAGAGMNDPHMTVFGIAGSPSSPLEIAAAAMGQIAASVRNDPARPVHTLPLLGIKAPALADRFTLAMRNTLLQSGIATLTVDRVGQVAIERAISTYQTDAFGNPDASMLDCETAFTLAAITRALKSAICGKYGRHKIVNDGTRIAAGQAAVTPSTLRAELVAQYRKLEAAGLVENAEAFKAALIVERNADDPNRVDVLFPPDLANQLRIFALLNQFRLQYPTA